MKRLILLSKYLPEKAVAKLESWVNKDRSSIDILFCDNAAELYYRSNPEYRSEPINFVEEAKSDLKETGLNFSQIDLNEFTDDSDLKLLIKKLKRVDAIYFNGGDAWVLMEYFHNTGLINHYSELIEEGLVHIGGSAGAVVTSNSLKYYELYRSNDYNGEIYDSGLNLTKMNIFPHYNRHDKPKYTNYIRESLDRFDGKIPYFLPLCDDQAVVVDGSDWQILNC